MERTRTARTAPLILVLLALLGGCAVTDHPRTATIEPGGYEDAFRRTLATLGRLGFEPDRIDARSGVITTHPEPTGGLAEPWSRQQTTPGQEIEDLLNRQRRTVRVVFRAADEPAADGASGFDLRAHDGPYAVEVAVVIERVHRPGREVDPASVRLQWTTEDPALRARGLHPLYAVPVGRDEQLERRLAKAAAGR
ncbi:MAG: hypothetical protein AAGB51_13385 [Planctomycetota bacterium]